MCVCVSQVEDSIRIAQALLADLSGSRSFLRFCDDLLEVLRSYEQEQFEDWSRDVLSGLSDPKAGIRYARHGHPLPRTGRCVKSLRLWIKETTSSSLFIFSNKRLQMDTNSQLTGSELQLLLL